MKKTFFAILLALVTIACSKNNDETAQKPASIDDVVGEWEAQVNEKTYQGTATLNLSADKNFKLILRGQIQGHSSPIVTYFEGTFTYEYPHLMLVEKNGTNKAKSQINDPKNELKIVEHSYSPIVGLVLKKKTK